MRSLLMVVPDVEPKPRVVEAITAGNGAEPAQDDDEEDEEDGEAA